MPFINFTWKQPPTQPIKTDRIFRFTRVDTTDVEKLLKKLKRKKATGIDELPSNLLKDSASVIAAPLTHIINVSFASAIFPEDWKKARLTPIFKAGKLTSVENYRPISILPIISKIAERIVHKQITTYLEKNNLISKKQYGYRKNCSTEMAATPSATAAS